ncbi:MAG: alpha-1,2-fucosyltransferase [Candidatus Pacebacteria bacterium]|nr:alpha-1,2-fucosyltransferase [Candidatus Paceibacterota bacterium]MBP9818508.1 alpha-1,2-fucosyltransferase [Candidatus Paceibacterota bacterium]
MILTRLRGGLGNQMFQYALGRVISKVHNEELRLDTTGYATKVQGDTPRSYRLQFFNIQGDIATPEDVLRAKYPFGIVSKVLRAFSQKILRKNYIDYHPELLERKSATSGTLYLDGFFQSEKYYTVGSNDFREMIQNDFQLKPEHISPVMKIYMDQIQAMGNPASDFENSVSLHVRRGDYVTNPSANKTQGLCSIQYYTDAIAHIKQHISNPHFFVFSDDIEWVKKNIPINSPSSQNEGGVLSPVTYISNPELQDYEELALMSLCKHNIIANSSFSWWGAWLNSNPDKIVIAPKQWTVSGTDHPNIIPEKWLKL